jgi:hypothetical protein
MNPGENETKYFDSFQPGIDCGLNEPSETEKFERWHNDFSLDPNRREREPGEQEHRYPVDG